MRAHKFPISHFPFSRKTMMNDKLVLHTPRRLQVCNALEPPQRLAKSLSWRAKKTLQTLRQSSQVVWQAQNGAWDKLPNLVKWQPRCPRAEAQLLHHQPVPRASINRQQKVFIMSASPKATHPPQKLFQLQAELQQNVNHLD